MAAAADKAREALAAEAARGGLLAAATLPARVMGLWAPHAGQRRIMAASRGKRIVACACGRRWGKSTLAAHVAAGVAALTDREVWVVAPTYDLASRTYDVAVRALRAMGEVERLSLSRRYAETRSGGRLVAKSADREDSLLGAGLAFVVVDEWPTLPARVWYQALAPSLADQRGHALLIGTPRGPGWARELFESTDRDLVSVSAPSWENDHVFPGGRDDAEILRWRASYERAGMVALWRQEIEASWDALSGRVYQAWDQATHVRPAHEVARGVTSVVIGVDWGFRNPCVALAVGRTADDEIRVLDEWRVTGATPGEQVAGIVALARRHRATRAVCDPSEPGQIEALRRAGLPAYGADNDVSAGILAVAQALAGGMLVADTCKGLIAEMSSYRYAERGQMREEPVKADDHGPDALRYAVVSGWQDTQTRPLWVTTEKPRMSKVWRQA